MSIPISERTFTVEEKTLRIYRIIRFRHGKSRTIKKGLTLEEAQEHCSNPNTKGTGWFDGYDLMKGIKCD